MRYTSTRNNDVNVSFAEALIAGYAPDGGLFVPATAQLPSLNGTILQTWQELDYATLLERILRLYIDPRELSDAELRDVCQNAMQGFDDPAKAIPVLPLRPAKVATTPSNGELNTTPPPQLFLSELFHGPTLCFKDLGLRVVIQLLQVFTRRRHQRNLTLVVATTGDTGPAAVQAVADLPASNNNNNESSRVRIVVQYPQGHISDFQRRQMTTIQARHEDSVRIVAFAGGGDDMDGPIKNVLQKQGSGDDDAAAIRTGINSYNIGRPIAQIVLHVWTYLRVVEQMGWELPDDLEVAETIDVVLPTGAMGNLTAGIMAKLMGLPIAKCICAVNVNDITHRVIQTADFRTSDQQTMIPTLSEAINIQVPYNFERILYYLTHQDTMAVKSFYDVPARLRSLYASSHNRLRTWCDSARITDDELCRVLQLVQQDFQYLADPHTAVALAAALEKCCSGSSSLDRPDRTTVVLATASPCKFEKAVTQAVGQDVWQSYAQSLDPAARRVMGEAEAEPVVFAAPEGLSLRETQQQWEKLLRDLLTELET